MDAFKDGVKLGRGSVVTSSRSGDSWRYLYATRITSDRTSGKILVNPVTYPDNGTEEVMGGTEVYAGIFGLTVR